MKRMELLAPAGSMEALRAAVSGGADAVYLGLGEFNARKMAQNFGWDNLEEALYTAHVGGLRVHVTMNTLLLSRELDEALRYCERLAEFGADALIVQDMGLVSRLRQQGYPLPLHASTQMTLHNAQGARWAAEEGFARIVLARETPIRDMAEIAGEDVEVEVFCHGALCVCVSGQCYFSGALGGLARSANRGACAQPCRLPYSAASASEEYLLSPHDLLLLPHLTELAAAGVDSLKIEGRLKSPDYVYTVASVYREALDALEAGESYALADMKRRLTGVFQRGFTGGYQENFVDSAVMAQDMPNNRGELLGTMKRGADCAMLAVPFPLHAGDVLQVRGEKASGIHRLERDIDKGDWIELSSKDIGLPLYRVSRANPPEIPPRRIVLRAKAVFRAGVPFTLELEQEDGLRVLLEGDIPQKARKAPLEEEALRRQLEKTGDTPYLLELDIDREENLFLPISSINALRRRALDALSQKRIEALRPVRPCYVAESVPRRPRHEGKALLIAQASREELLEVLAEEADLCYYAPSDLTSPARWPKDLPLLLPCYVDSATLSNIVREASDRQYIIANPSQELLPHVLAADYPLHALNSAAGDYWGRRGARTTASPELNPKQTCRLLEQGGAWEVLVYGRLPLMTLRHCPQLALQKNAPPHAQCRACDQCAEGLRFTDRMGYEMEFAGYRLESGCMLSPLNALPRDWRRHLSALAQSGAAGLRLIFTNESPEEARALLRAFREMI